MAMMRVSVLRIIVLAALLAMLASGAASARAVHAASASAFVRVNQVGYPTGAAKRAVREVPLGSLAKSVSILFANAAG